jgi:hypothetical protein
MKNSLKVRREAIAARTHTGIKKPLIVWDAPTAVEYIPPQRKEPKAQVGRHPDAPKFNPNAPRKSAIRNFPPKITPFKVGEQPVSSSASSSSSSASPQTSSSLAQATPPALLPTFVPSMEVQQRMNELAQAGTMLNIAAGVSLAPNPPPPPGVGPVIWTP